MGGDGNGSGSEGAEEEEEESQTAAGNPKKCDIGERISILQSVMCSHRIYPTNAAGKVKSNSPHEISMIYVRCV